MGKSIGTLESKTASTQKRKQAATLDDHLVEAGDTIEAAVSARLVLGDAIFGAVRGLESSDRAAARSLRRFGAAVELVALDCRDAWAQGGGGEGSMLDRSANAAVLH